MTEEKNKTIRVCHGTGCLSSKSDKVTDKFKDLDHDNDVEICGCHGFCSQGPIVMVDDVFYANVEETHVDRIVLDHLKGGEPVEKYLYQCFREDKIITNYDQIPFYSKQTRIVLANCGFINPEKIDDYFAS